MAFDQLIHTHPTGKTTGTAERPGQDHVGEALTFDLPDEVTRLRGEDTWRRNGRNTRTLVKEGNLRVVVVTLEAGHHIPEHRTAARLAVQVLSGHLRMLASGQDIDLPAGRMLAINYAVGFEIEALETSAFLLTVAWAGSEWSADKIGG